MKIEITKGALQDALKKVSGISDGRSVEILANVKIEAADGKVSFTTTNLDVTLKTETECKVVEPGATTVGMKRLECVASVLPKEEVSIESDAKERTTVVSGDMRVVIAGLPASQFPMLPSVKDSKVFRIGGAMLLSLLRKSSYAICRDGTRKTLEGVFVELDGTGICCVATDGKRLGYGRDDLASGLTASFILPAQTVSILQKFIDDGEVEVSTVGTQVRFVQASGRDVFYSKLVDGTYPAYRNVLPKYDEGNSNVVEFERVALVNALDRAIKVTSEANPSVVLSFSAAKADIEGVSDLSTCDFHETVLVKNAGNDFKFTVNPKFVIDALSACDADDMTLVASKTAGPVEFKSADPKCYALVMPLSLHS